MKLPVYNANRTMQLLNKTALKGVPPLYSQDGKGTKAIAYLKFFIDSWTWYITEIDHETGYAFGKAISHHCPEGELGYVDIPNQLALMKGSVRQAVERDRYFKPTILEKCI